MKRLHKIDKRYKKLFKLEQFVSQYQKILAERFIFRQFSTCFRQLHMKESESEHCL